MHPLLFVLLAANVDPAALATCTTIDDDRQRLTCYDALLRPAGRAVPDAGPAAPVVDAAVSGVAVAAAPAPAAAGSVPAVPVTAVAPAVAPANPVEEFGLSAERRLAKQEPVQVPQEMDSINARVAVVRQLRNDRFVLILENDQIWTQVEPTPRQRFFVGDEIRIRRASLGSFLATGPNTGGAIRVRRVE